MTERRMDPVGGEVVFVPLTREQWRRLIAAGRLVGPLPAYGVTPALLTWGEFGPNEIEDARFAAQSLAGVAALTLADAQDGERRIVLAVRSVRFTAEAASVLGAGTVDQVVRSQVQAVFSDDDAVPVDEVRLVARGLALETAWDDPTIAAFATEHDLGWYTPEEAADW